MTTKTITTGVVCDGVSSVLVGTEYRTPVPLQPAERYRCVRTTPTQMVPIDKSKRDMAWIRIVLQQQ